MGRRKHIVIAEPSIIIRSGLISVLNRISTLNIYIAEISDINTLSAQLCRYKPDVLIVDPSNLGVFSLQQIKKEIECPCLKTIALQSTLTNHSTLKHYDQTISIYDNTDIINDKLTALLESDRQTELKQGLGKREQEVLVLVVRGMSNKQIAEHLSLSFHTVTTHRRNIASKLQIHSSAGLAIYAIANKLVDINDVVAI